MKLLVTGGAGFIGSAFVRRMVARGDVNVVNVDKLTYAGNLDSLAAVGDASNYTFERVDICDFDSVRRLLRNYRPDAVAHLAAESHVDRSIDGAGEFIRTNINGTHSLLEAARLYYDSLEGRRAANFRFLHVSTDEVYGSLGPDGSFTESSPYAPNSPYSASKAAADHLVRAWFRTYGLPTVVSNCSNNYGPFQFPEKLIPLMIINAFESRTLPVYGRGRNVRDWLYVEDHVAALELVLVEGCPGESYNVGGGSEVSNIDVVGGICRLMDELSPRPFPHAELIQFVPDRPGHDFRYAVDATKIQEALGWRPRERFRSGLRRTVEWYLANRPWWERARARVRETGRVGLSGKSEASRRIA